MIIGLSIVSCTENPKSELVLHLEKIFYADNFTDIPDEIFNVKDYGAQGDSISLNTEAIQKTIDAAHKAGGGKVVFPEGTYLTGALFLKSNIEFHIGKGVILKAIQDNSHYPELPTRIAGIEMEWPAAVINVYEQKNVRVTGTGTIDGNGKFWWDKFWGDPKFSGGMWNEYKSKNIRWAIDYDCKRVRPVVVYKSENVLLKDFTVERSGFWTISLTYSNRVHVDGLIIRNNIGGYGPSSDGINTDSSKDILVENCDIDCNDDNLCIKSGKDADGLRVNRPAENIVYRNCITRQGHGLITLGSETSGGMKNIEVYGLEAIGTNIGIRFKSAKVRGGLMENIWFHDIKIKDVDYPFHFELNWYPEYSYPVIPKEIPEDEILPSWRILTEPVLPPEKGIPLFQKIRFSNIEVKNAKQGIYANAYPEKPMKNFTWENIQIEAKESGIINHATHWKMDNVILKTESGKPVEHKNCEKVEQPEIVDSGNEKTSPQKPTRPLSKQLQEIKDKNPSQSLIPYNPVSQQVIENKDTTLSFSESLHIYIIGNEKSTIRFNEPLGDGFYYSPVEISWNPHKGIISVEGQKSHTYLFKAEKKLFPESFPNSGKWQYDPATGYYNRTESGKKFKFKMFHQ